MKTVVVVPTYNEAGNIERLLDELLAHDGIHVLVVDDNSPDGTADLVKKHGSSRVHLLLGEKQGLGVAYMRGLDHAVRELGADVVFEMDADFSHDPADIPRLLGAIEDGADFVIGSRYTQGGRIDGWSAFRRFVSWGANTLVARPLAGLWHVSDCTAGFRAMTAEVVKSVDWDSFPGKGYGFQVALLHHAVQHEFSVKEVPVTFTDRVHGESKIGFSDALEGFVLSVRLGFTTYSRILKFVTVGGSGALVNLGLFVLLFRILGLYDLAAQAIAVETSILWNYFWHDRWTFKERKQQTYHMRLLRYNAVALVGLGVNLAVFWSLTRGLGLLEELAALTAIVIAFAVNFTLSTLWAWKKKL